MTINGSTSEYKIRQPKTRELEALKHRILNPKTIISLRSAIAEFLVLIENLSEESSEESLIKKEIMFSLAVIFQGKEPRVAGTASEINNFWRQQILPQINALKAFKKYTFDFKDLLKRYQSNSVENPSDEIARIINKRRLEEEDKKRQAKNARRMAALRKKASTLGVKKVNTLDENALVSAIRIHKALQDKDKRQKEKAKKTKLKETEERHRLENAKRLGIDPTSDIELSIRLEQEGIKALDSCAKESIAYVYFKAWVLPNGLKWYKIGITNDPSRRDNEQNVLPVPAETLSLISLPSIDLARTVETVFHSILNGRNIKGAGNKELFSLNPQEVSSIISALSKIESRKSVFSFGR